MPLPEDSREVRIRVGADKIRVVAPLDGKDIKDQDINLEPSNDPLRRETIEVLSDMLREKRLLREREVKLLGGRLYSVLFDNQIGVELHGLLRDEELKVVRVVLEFEASQQSLASWPWEYLYCPEQLGLGGSGYFLSEITRLVLIRHLPSDAQARRLRVRDGQVKVLFVASSPTGLETVEYEPVWECLKSLDKIELRELLPKRPDPDAPPGATYRNFLGVLEAWEPHIIHLLAHGRHKAEHGEVAFMDDDEGQLWIRDDALANDLWQEARNLRCVFLQTCESALAGNDLRDRYHAISGVAMHLAQKDIPAVVGMQYEIHQGAANLFAQTFYQHLARSVPFDVAVQRGRSEVRMEERHAAARKEDGQSRLSFGLPVLYLREPDESLFPSQTASGREGIVGVVHDVTATRPTMTDEPAEPAPGVEPAEFCPWCNEQCDPWERYCVNSHPLKCASCETPVTKRRDDCGWCGKPLQAKQS